MNTNLLSACCTLVPFLLPLRIAFFFVFRMALCHGDEPRPPQANYIINNGSLSGLKQDDPKLEHAYRAFFQSLEGRTDGVGSVVADIRSRGNSVSSLLLKLFDENSEGSVRENIVFWFDEFQGLSIDPFRNRIRYLIERDPKTLPRKSCVYFARFLSKHGSSHDVPLLQSMISHDPHSEIGLRVGHFLRLLQDRLSTERTSESQAGVTKPSSTVVLKQAEGPSLSRPLPPSEESTSLNRMSVIAVLIVAATGLVWLLVKKRK